MNLTAWDAGVFAVFFCGAWLLAPVMVRHVLATAARAVDGFDRERVAVGRARMLAAIGAISGSAGLAVWSLTRSVGFAALAMGVGLAAPGWVLSAYQAWRRRRFQAQFMDVLLMIANSLRAGFNLSQAVEITAREMPAPACEEFGRVVRDRDLGVTLDEGLDRLAVRMEGESVRIFVTAVQVGRQTGGDLTRLIDGLVKMIRDRERVEERVRTMTAETRFQGYTLAALPYLLLTAWFCVDPAGVRGIFSTGWGRALLAAGTAFNLMALAVIRNMATVKV